MEKEIIEIPDPEVNTLAAMTRAITAGARSALAKPTARIFAPRRFQSLQLVKGRSGSPLQESSFSFRETLRIEGFSGISQRVALPFVANMASGIILFGTYTTVESWAYQKPNDSTFSLSTLLKSNLEGDRAGTTSQCSEGQSLTEDLCTDRSQPTGNDYVLPVTALAATMSGAAHAVVACPLDNFLHNLHIVSTRRGVEPPQSLWLLSKQNLEILRGRPPSVPRGSEGLGYAANVDLLASTEGLKLKPILYGWKGALLRDMAGYGAFFLGFEGTKRAMLEGTGSRSLDALFVDEKMKLALKNHSQEGPPLTMLGTIVAGMVGGVGFRVLSFPIDWTTDFFLAHTKLVERYYQRGHWLRLASAVFGRNRLFWPRFGRNVLFSLPGAALTFVVYEHAKYQIA